MGIRWKFVDLDDVEESRLRAPVLEQVDRWWEEFRARAGVIDAHFRRQADFDVPTWMHQHFNGPIDSDINWEFGPAVKAEGHRLCLTTSGDQSKRTFVDAILARAPQIDGWEFYPSLLPDPPEIVEQVVEARARRSCAGMTVQAKIGAHHRVDLLWTVPHGQKADDASRTTAIRATESALGEEVLDRWIGVVEVADAPKRGWFGNRKATGLPIAALPQLVESMIEAITAQNPDRPWHQIDTDNDVEWALYETKAIREPDAPARGDQYIGHTCASEAGIASINDTLFNSVRFSRFGETFCYLKVMHNQEKPDLEDREVMREAIDARLVPAKLGRAIGGGTGVYYWYIDLALTDVESAANLLRDVARKQAWPAESWLLFSDAWLRTEWIGLKADTPRPVLAGPD